MVQAYSFTSAPIANINVHAAHAHPYQRTTAQATPERKSGTRGEIHGTRKSKIYHLPGCTGYERMSPAQIGFPLPAKRKPSLLAIKKQGIVARCVLTKEALRTMRQNPSGAG
jgi:hypothetical protein